MFWNIVLFHMIPANCPECLVAAVIISCLGSSPAFLREIDGELDAVWLYEVKTVESQIV